MKPTTALEGEDTYKMFNNEQIINLFDPQGVPWGSQPQSRPTKW